MKRRARKAPVLIHDGATKCDGCGGELLAVLAVGFNGQRLHPDECFDRELGKVRRALEQAIHKSFPHRRVVPR